MWKHKTKWLVRGGRKVKCYLCGKKILAKGDLFLFHGDTGYYSHQSCQAESTTISGNERRRAVKKIAVGAAVVGAIAAGAGKFIDISSQSKGSNSPASQTILTSQGLILPALTSDPANPVPGQMWYRSDAGVEAHFDGVQNRVVYSSEINDGNVNVTSKGIVNGLSVLPNDGKGGFGPDTTKGATAPGQYGSPYTQAFGIQEAGNYAFSQYTIINDPATVVSIPAIKFLAGLYQINSPISWNPEPFLPSGDGLSCFVLYSDPNAWFVYNGSGYFMTIAGNTSTTNTGLYIYNLEIALGSNATGGIQWAFYDSSGNPTTSNSAFATITDMASGGSNTSQYLIYMVGPLELTIKSSVLSGTVYANIYNSISIDCPSFLYGYDGNYQINATFVYIRGVKTLTQIVTGTLAPACQVAIFENVTGTMEFSAYQVIVKGGYNVSYTTSGFRTSVIDIQNVTGPTSGAFITVNAPVGTLRCKNVIPGYANATFLSIGTGGSIIVYDISTPYDLIAGYSFASIPVNKPTLSTNPPVSGTAYQNTNTYDIRLKIPVTYSPTSSAAATLATGTSSTSTVTTSTKVSYPAGITTGIIDTYEMVVQAGQYFELVVTNATIGTVEVQAA